MIDLITVWPVGYDYPKFRKFVRENRSRFNRVIIVWTNTNSGNDLSVEIQEKMKADDIAFMQSPKVAGDQDWRDVATNHALSYSQSEWVWFTEQDFTAKEHFWDYVQVRMEHDDVIGIDVQGRLHPACLFVKRKVLDKTRRDFSPIKDIADHFSMIQQDLKNEKTSYIPQEMWYHQNGLTHNLWLHQIGEKITYKPEEFYQYLKEVKDL